MFNINKPAGDPVNAIATMVFGLAYCMVIQTQYGGDSKKAIMNLTLVPEVEKAATAYAILAQDLMQQEADAPMDYTQYDVYQREVIALVLQTKIRLLTAD